MIDIHCHLIPKIDDGSRSIEETFNLINEAKEAGFTDIILTPHYITDYYENKASDINTIKNSLQKILDEKNINVQLYAGMEIYICQNLKELIDNGQVMGLANSNYILVEFPLSSKPKYIDDVLFTLQGMGYTVIIAHPERYKAVQEDFDFAINLVDKGCLLQSNYASIVGFYGESAKKVLKKLLKMDMVTFLGTDTHRQGSIYKIMPQIIKKLRKEISDEKLFELTNENPSKIINK